MSKQFLVLIGWQSVLLALLGLVAYAWALSTYGAGEHSRTIALFALIGIQLGHVFNCRSRRRSAFSGIFRNPFLWLAVLVVVTLQLLAAYLTPLTRVLRTVPPTQRDLLVIAGCTVTPIIVVEIVKWIVRRRKGKRLVS